MKKVIKFSNLFLPCIIFSLTVITLGGIGFFTKGLNYGIDFQAGYIEKVRIAPTALELTYDGAQTVAISQSSAGIDLVVTGVGSDNKTFNFPNDTYPTVGAFAAAVVSVPGVAIKVNAPASVSMKSVFPNSVVLPRLTGEAYRFHYSPADAKAVTADDIRKIVSGTFPDASVQNAGSPADVMFQVRLRDDGTDTNASQNLRTNLNNLFVAAFGDENVAVISTDFVGSRFSSNLASQSFWLVLITLLLILLYCMLRFRWDFALGGVLAIAHDAMMMMSFVVFTRLQFNSTTIAAILTILGYSINDTVVVYDRIRENMKINPNMKTVDILNLAQTEMLGRTIITVLVTMLAVTSLYVFTTGDMKDFALMLLVGMVGGVYSTIYIASAFIAFVSRFRKDEGKIKEKPVAQVITSGEVI